MQETNEAMAKTAKKSVEKSAMKAAKKSEKKRGPKDRSYVNQSQKYEVEYASKRKTAAKTFGAKKAK